MKPIFLVYTCNFIFLLNILACSSSAYKNAHHNNVQFHHNAIPHPIFTTYAQDMYSIQHVINQHTTTTYDYYYKNIDIRYSNDGAKTVLIIQQMPKDSTDLERWHNLFSLNISNTYKEIRHLAAPHLQILIPHFNHTIGYFDYQVRTGYPGGIIESALYAQHNKQKNPTHAICLFTKKGSRNLDIFDTVEVQTIDGSLIEICPDLTLYARQHRNKVSKQLLYSSQKIPI